MSPIYSIFHFVPLSDLKSEADGREPVGRCDIWLAVDDGLLDDTRLGESALVSAGEGCAIADTDGSRAADGLGGKAIQEPPVSRQ